MQSCRRNRAAAALGMAILVALAQSSPGNTEAPGASLAPPPCPRAKAQKNPFDETSVTFDSVSEKRDERSTLVTYCVHVDTPKNKYLVDWPDTNMKDVFTDTDGELQSSRVVSGDPSVTSSLSTSARTARVSTWEHSRKPGASGADCASSTPPCAQLSNARKPTLRRAHG
jgi:hypothetical protein